MSGAAQCRQNRALTRFRLPHCRHSTASVIAVLSHLVLSRPCRRELSQHHANVIAAALCVCRCNTRPTACCKGLVGENQLGDLVIFNVDGQAIATEQYQIAVAEGVALCIYLNLGLPAECPINDVALRMGAGRFWG